MSVDQCRSLMMKLADANLQVAAVKQVEMDKKVREQSKKKSKETVDQKMSGLKGE